jgi:hypothetical protein
MKYVNQGNVFLIMDLIQQFFAYPYGEGSYNPTVVNTVAKYYYLARTDSVSPNTFFTL